MVPLVPSRKNPARLVPTLCRPEIAAGLEKPGGPVLMKPEMELPRLAIPDCTTPMFRTPELPKSMFVRPELLAPLLKKPDELPVPLLKNPEDGAVVEFPKPGWPPKLNIVQSTGPMLARLVISTTVLGPPMAPCGAGTGASTSTCGMVRESIFPVKAGIGPKPTVKPNGISDIVIPLYTTLVMVEVIGILMGMVPTACNGISGIVMV
ncbi:hypothetical protein LAUMK42_05585 [Mycobacterium persicum]|nr:hypothetical protein LAUMK42_05585 [Mycobacterium persicum]